MRGSEQRGARRVVEVEVAELELELIQSHMAQKPVLRGEVGCTCVAREVAAVISTPAPGAGIGAAGREASSRGRGCRDDPDAGGCGERSSGARGE